MDIDFRWGGDPNIVLAVEAALVASIPIQVRLSSVCWISLSYEKLSKFWLLFFASVEGSPDVQHRPCYIPTRWWDSVHFCCCCCPTCWGNFWGPKMKKRVWRVGGGMTMHSIEFSNLPFCALVQIKQIILTWSWICKFSFDEISPLVG